MKSHTETLNTDVAGRALNQPQLDMSWRAQWCPNYDPHDRIWEYSTEKTEWLAERMGVSMTPRLFARMRDVGMGPYKVATAGAELSVLCNWASFIFDLPTEGPPALDSDRIFEAIKSNEIRSPSWLVAAEDGPQADDLVRTMEAIGANVLRARTPFETAQVVDALQVHGMIMCFNHRIEAEFVIAFNCMERAIHFVIITDGPERPASMARGGIVLHNPHSPYEVIAAIESLPPARLVGLDLPYDGVAAERPD